MSEYRVQFEVFEGPLDLLLHLVKKEEVDIYQVNLTKIATEFVAYLEQMRSLDLEVAGEFLVMAATLIYIKSRELLPVEQQAQVEAEDDDGDDPRFELIRRLVEYKKFKDAAAQLQVREGDQENTYERRPAKPEFEPVDAPAQAPVSVFDLIGAVSLILRRFHARDDIREIDADPYTVSEKIESLRALLAERGTLRFSELFASARSRAEVVVTFLAILELTRLKQLSLSQDDEFGEIQVSSVLPAAVAMAEVEADAGPVQMELAAAVPSEAASPDSLPESVPVSAASDEPQAA